MFAPEIGIAPSRPHTAYKDLISGQIFGEAVAAIAGQNLRSVTDQRLHHILDALTTSRRPHFLPSRGKNWLKLEASVSEIPRRLETSRVAFLINQFQIVGWTRPPAEWVRETQEFCQQVSSIMKKTGIEVQMEFKLK